jgi:alpha-glucosidase
VSVAAQESDAGSTLELYRSALTARRARNALSFGSFTWLDSPSGTVVFARETADETIVCAVNLDADLLDLGSGELVLSSEPLAGSSLPPGSAAWVKPSYAADQVTVSGSRMVAATSSMASRAVRR